MAIATGARILADDILPLLNGQMGSVAITFTTQTSFTVAVSFPVAYPVGAAVNVHTNIHNGTAAASGWNSRAFNITNTGFTLLVFGASSSWSAIPVQWSAFCVP